MIPDPSGQVFTGRILESVNIVQAVMIELLKQGLEGVPQISEIHHPTGMLANRTTDMNFDPERVPMHTGALVPFRNVGQTVSGFDLKNTENIHGRIVPSMNRLRKALSRS